MNKENNNVAYLDDVTKRFDRQKNKIADIPSMYIDVETEKTVLAEIILSELNGINVISAVSSVLKSHDFSDLKNEILYRSVLALHKDQISVDYLSIKNRLEQTEYRSSNCFEEIGGMAYLKEISEQEFIAPENLEAHIKILIEKSCYRSFYLNQVSTADMMKSHSLSLDKFFGVMEGYIKEVRDRLSSIQNDDVSEISDLAEGFITLLESNVEKYKARIATSDDEESNIIYGWQTGLPPIDEPYSGIQKHQLMGIMAPPNVGKTALLFSMVAGLTKHNDGLHIVLFTTGEISQENVLYRLYSIGTELFGTKPVTTKQMKSGTFDEEGLESIMSSIENFKKRVKLHIYTKGLYMDDFVNQVKKLENKHGPINLIGIDYLQNIELNDGSISLCEKIPKIISKTNRLLDHDLIYRPATIILTQQNTANERRGDNIPRLRDAEYGNKFVQSAQNFTALTVNEEDTHSAIVHTLKNKEGGLSEPCVLKRSITSRFYYEPESIIA